MIYVCRVLFIAIVVLAGCQRELIKTPNVYLDMEENPFADVPPQLRTSTVDLLYVTDRQPEGGDESYVKYGYERSRSVAFGSLIVELGNGVSWDALVEASRTRNRRVRLPLSVRSVTETHRFPETPPPLVRAGDSEQATGEYRAAKRLAVARLQEEVRRRLAMTPRKEAFVFVHGYNNTIEVAAYRLAELWHFLGREGVPILYSWPAGYPALIRGYTHDRESSEFTIFHLKEMLRALAAVPELKKINLIGHSRGTDVVMTAVRELIVVARARGDDPRSALKIGSIVLAAPDIDGDVAGQRYSAEELNDGWERITLYVTRNDRALGTAEWLFSSPRRFGRIRPEQLNDIERQRTATVRNGEIVDARIRTDYLGHGYFLSNPATCSDLILVLRYDRPPGAEHGRPLTEILKNYYIINDDYPRKAAPMPAAKRGISTTPVR